jgi:phospholipase/carboxylesterase
MSNSPVLSGPVDVPQGAEFALVCLHGFGSNGQDLIGLAGPLRAALGKLGERLAVFAPDGPSPVPDSFGIGGGRQWFSDMNWSFRDKSGIATASKLVEAYVLETVVKTYGIASQKTIILGFSQGAMTALYAVPRWELSVGGLISVAGVAMWQEELDANTCQKPPVLLVHGIDDDIVAADQTVNAATGLQALGFNAEYHLIPNLAHGINAPALAHVATFIQDTLKT